MVPDFCCQVSGDSDLGVSRHQVRAVIGSSWFLLLRPGSPNPTAFTLPDRHRLLLAAVEFQISPIRKTLRRNRTALQSPAPMESNHISVANRITNEQHFSGGAGGSRTRVQQPSTSESQAEAITIINCGPTKAQSVLKRYLSYSFLAIAESTSCKPWPIYLKNCESPSP